MFEVYPVSNGFQWRMVSAAGRCLFYGDETVYASDLDAANAATKWRRSFWENAARFERFPATY